MGLLGPHLEISPPCFVEKTRDELRVQVYDAMAEKENKHSENVDGKQSESAEEEKTETLQAADEQKPGKMDEENHKDGEKTTETEEKERTAGSEEETLEEDEYANKEKAGGDLCYTFLLKIILRIFQPF